MRSSFFASYRYYTSRFDLSPFIQQRHLAGKQLGKYTLLQLIGQSDMGAVYIAQDEMLGRQVALKASASLALQPKRCRLDDATQALQQIANR
jgi:serine/threonine protein kinase